MKPAFKKYGNKRVEWLGQSFDSKAELNRYYKLIELEKIGLITQLTRQVSFVLAPKVAINGVTKRALTYRADFSYVQNGKQIVEDTKGYLTDVYKIKRHLMKHVHNIDILETR